MVGAAGFASGPRIMGLAKVSGLIVAVLHLGLAGCTLASLGERARLVDVPLAAAQSNLEFSVSNVARNAMSCAENAACLSEAGRSESRSLAQEVGQIAKVLQAGVAKAYPDAAWCAPKAAAGGCFDVQVVDNDEVGSSSSANGRIAVNSALGRWRPYDGALAFVIAREMGHVIARHPEENSSVNIVTSVILNIFVPVSGLFKGLLSAGGGWLAATGNRDVQTREADAIAIRLLETSGYRLRDVSQNLLRVPVSADDNAWSADFLRASAKLILHVRATEAALAAAGGAPAGEFREIQGHQPD